ncbi:uncharacterized protein DSM5745_03868 [Aspergillus mulundensis]|uniref:D-lactate dehydrogenase (cytochrome) n=1 Tax=Aspergillus mulundensis TaxID=1810919 RepID=A0A3D8SB06_9EURO|nr:hypothetical protein DSM5745_03868 [Aspergillus mulundensis]RDW83542.1 hypothetical protein DSM5745_03868 [Aspergillus mulundensis]
MPVTAMQQILIELTDSSGRRFSRNGRTGILQDTEDARCEARADKSSAVEKIHNELGEDAISTDEEDLKNHGYSQYSSTNIDRLPVAVAYPQSTEDVAAIARICHEYRVPMIAFSGGSSIEGHFSAPFGGVSVDFMNMNKIVEFHPEEYVSSLTPSDQRLTTNSMDIVVQPAVSWVDMNYEIKDSGLFFPVDPGPPAKIGGMVATNCSGTNAIRYGTMNDWVINLTVVLADGGVIKTRKRPRKSSAGYNLNGLFTGSEGTLGFVTEATLKLAPIPEKSAVAVTTFSSMRDAALAAIQIVHAGIPVGAVEILDDVQMDVVNKMGGTGSSMGSRTATGQGIHDARGGRGLAGGDEECQGGAGSPLADEPRQDIRRLAATSSHCVTISLTWRSRYPSHHPSMTSPVPAPPVRPPVSCQAQIQEHCEHYPSPESPSLSKSISGMGAPATDPQPATPSAASCNVACAPGLSSLLSDDYSLPPRKTADWLMNIYFTSSHLFYHWVHKESFLASYDFIWSSQDGTPLDSFPDVGVGGRNCPPIMFYCALNAMFAIACEFSNMPPQEKRSTSLMFYERMKGLINIDILDNGSLAHVQALLLVAIYLQCTPYPNRCWNIVGMAYRISIGLGLHLRRYGSDMTNLEKEIRWRTWCACVHMDIMVSMTMGRPAMTPVPYNVPLPSPIDDKYLAMEGTVEQPPGEVSGNLFLYENTRLTGILGKILSTIYHSAEPTSEPNTPQKAALNLQAVLDIDCALVEYEQSLNPALQWDPGAQSPLSAVPLCRRLSNVLHARFLHLRLLLYRTAFSQYCSSLTNQGEVNSKPGTRRWSVLCRSNCAAGCVQAACDLIESLSRATMQDASGAWWYGIFYLISAGFILLLAYSSDASFEGPDKDHRDRAWDRCIHTLNCMVDVHPSARDYEIALTGLRQAQVQSTRSPAEAEAQSTNIDSNGTIWDEQNNQVEAGPSGLYNALDPLISNWDNGIEDIMLPAQFLQDMGDGLLLPSFF